MRACCDSCGGKIVITRGTARLNSHLSRSYGVCQSCKKRKRIIVEVVDSQDTMDLVRTGGVDIETIGGPPLPTE